MTTKINRPSDTGNTDILIGISHPEDTELEETDSREFVVTSSSNNQIIQKVFMNRVANQKLVTIPKYCNIEEGDFVEIIKKEFKE